MKNVPIICFSMIKARKLSGCGNLICTSSVFKNWYISFQRFFYRAYSCSISPCKQSVNLHGRQSYLSTSIKPTSCNILSRMDDKASVILITLMAYTFLSLCGQSACLKSQIVMFLTKYRSDIERYIMTGYGRGWKNCDLIQMDFQQSSLSDETPLFLMDTKQLHTSDILTTFSSSTCLLISAPIKNNQSLSSLIHLGWSIVQRKRLALVLKLTKGITLSMAPNTTKLPFLIAAEVGEKEQFLCPVVGESIPRLQDTKCNLSYTSYKGQTLRVGIFGGPPNFIGKFFIKKFVQAFLQ